MRLLAQFFFDKARARFIEQYPELFGEGSKGDLSSISNFGRKWGWYQSLWTLCGSDITKLEHITKLNVHTCFTWLAFTKDKNELEAQEIKKKFK